MERNNVISECKYIEFISNRQNYKCKKCGDKSYKSINGLIEKFPNIYIDFVIRILINLPYY